MRTHLQPMVRERKIAEAIKLRKQGLTLEAVGKKVGMGSKWVWKVVPHNPQRRVNTIPFELRAWGIKHSYHKPPNNKEKTKVTETMRFTELFSTEEVAKGMLNSYGCNRDVRVVPVIITEIK